MTLLELFDLLRKHLRLVLALPLGFALVVAVATAFMPDKYTATTDMYVLAKATSGDGATNYTDLSASQMLTNDVTTLIKSDRVEADAAEAVGLDDFKGYDIDVTSSTTTRVITLSVTGTDPETAATVANALVQSVSGTAQAVMDVQSINQIDSATAPTAPSGPNRPLYILVGALAGLFVAVAVVVLADTLNTRVRSGSDVEEMIGVPVIGHFPEIGRS